MALPSSGPISLNDIQDEFGGVNPIGLDEYDSIVNPSSGDLQEAFVTPGTYSWTCPAGVTSVCVVCVGAGGGGGASSERCGGSGGGLAWRNNISVTAGTSYTVVVGSGGGGNGAGGDSYFSSTSTVRGSGGLGGGPGGTQAGGAFNQGGGSDGGGGIGGGTLSRFLNAHGGGGAGGYSGAGGDAVNNANGENGAGGGGGAGADGGGGTNDRGGGGGGTGIYGQGSNGAGGVYSDGAGGGGSTANSTGTDGQSDSQGGDGGFPGGGGGQRTNGSPGSGGDGAVRILWGSGRSYPSTNTADQTGASSNVGDNPISINDFYGLSNEVLFDGINFSAAGDSFTLADGGSGTRRAFCLGREANYNYTSPNVIWASVSGTSFAKFELQSGTFTKVGSNINSGMNVMDMTDTGTHIILVSYQGDVNRYNKSTGSLETETDDNVNRRGVVWKSPFFYTGAWTDLDSIDVFSTQASHTTYQNIVSSTSNSRKGLAYDPEDDLFYQCFDNGGGTIFSTTNSSSNTNSVSFTSEGTLPLWTDRGNLFSFDILKNSNGKFIIGKIINTGQIWCLYEIT